MVGAATMRVVSGGLYGMGYVDYLDHCENLYLVLF